MADPIARQYVGALATHLYDEPVSNVSQMKTLADQYQLPLWMTEFTMGAMGTTGRPQDPFGWASLMHDLISNYNVSAVDYLWGYFGEWEGNATTLISLNNTGATYDGFTLNKTYYTTGQFSRFIEPGAVRVKADSNDAGIATTAYLSDSELVLVAINSDHSNKDVTFNLNGLPDITRFTRVRTSAIEDWATLSPLAILGPNFTTTLSANSITTFVASLPANPLGDYNQNGIVDAADYVVWRKNDGTQPGYDTWRVHFGQTAGGGAGNSADAAIPEPTTLVLLLVGMLAMCSRRLTRVS